MTQWLAGMAITADRLNAGLDTVETSAGLTAGSGFTVTDYRAARLGKMVVLDMYVTRTDATSITAINGNIVSPEPIACIVANSWRPTSGTINGAWDDGTAEGGFVIGNDGVCTLRTASSDITTGRNLRLHIAFIQS